MAEQDGIDPLDAAFSNPKAGKKIKAGERLPGMDQVADVSIEADAALSKALDDAFSTPKFESRPQSVPDQLPDSASVAAAEEKMARSLDDAFANPKAGEKIRSTQIDDGVSLEQLGLSGYQNDDLKFDRAMAASKGGLTSPKFLVIGMILAVVIIGGVLAVGADPKPVKPNVIRLTN